MWRRGYLTFGVLVLFGYGLASWEGSTLAWDNVLYESPSLGYVVAPLLGRGAQPDV
jgi:hypothetical protein